MFCFHHISFCSKQRLRLLVARLERHLEYAILQIEPVEAVNGRDRLLVVGHGDKAEALALVALAVADDLDTLHGAERSEQLPQNALVGLGAQVVHEYAPARVVDGAQARAAQACWRRRGHQVTADVGGGGRANCNRIGRCHQMRHASDRRGRQRVDAVGRGGRLNETGLLLMLLWLQVQAVRRLLMLLLLLVMQVLLRRWLMMLMLMMLLMMHHGRRESCGREHCLGQVGDRRGGVHGRVAVAPVGGGTVRLVEASACGHKGRQRQAHHRLDRGGRVGELDHERVGHVLDELAVELSDGDLGLVALVESHETHSLRLTFQNKRTK